MLIILEFTIKFAIHIDILSNIDAYQITFIKI